MLLPTPFTGVARKLCISPVLVSTPQPSICPRELMSNAANKYNGEFEGTRVLRSVITRFVSARPAVEVCIAGLASHLAAIVDGRANAGKVPRKGAEVGHGAFLPEEAVERCVTRQRGTSDHLVLVVDALWGCERASEVAEISEPALLPQ